MLKGHVQGRPVRSGAAFPPSRPRAISGVRRPATDVRLQVVAQARRATAVSSQQSGHPRAVPTLDAHPSDVAAGSLLPHRARISHSLCAAPCPSQEPEDETIDLDALLADRKAVQGLRKALADEPRDDGPKLTRRERRAMMFSDEARQARKEQSEQAAQAAGPSADSSSRSTRDRAPRSDRDSASRGDRERAGARDDRRAGQGERRDRREDRDRPRGMRLQ